METGAISTARLAVRVRDIDGNALPGAEGVLTGDFGDELRDERHEVSDTSGQMRFDRLPPGVFALRLSRDGFATWERRKIRLDMGQKLIKEAVLKRTPAG